MQLPWLEALLVARRRHWLLCKFTVHEKHAPFAVHAAQHFVGDVVLWMFLMIGSEDARHVFLRI